MLFAFGLGSAEELGKGDPVKTGVAGLALIKQFESCRLEAYRCPAGILTIGYGSTENVYDGMRIPMDEALRRLQDHLAPMEAEIGRLVKVPLTQNQFDALACFCFNCGIGAFEKSTLLRCLNMHHYDDAAQEFLKWDKVNGVPCAGLLRRRQAERELFLKA